MSEEEIKCPVILAVETLITELDSLLATLKKENKNNKINKESKFEETQEQNRSFAN